MNGGYIICPQAMSDKLIKDLKSTATKTGALNGYKDLCAFMLNAAKIGKPILMSGKLDIEYDLNAYYHVNYSVITSVTAIDDNVNIVIPLDNKYFLLSIADFSSGRLSYNAINLA